MATIEEFMNPKVSQWIFVKPNPSKGFTVHVKKTTNNVDNVLFTVYTPCTDYTGNRHVQGFVQTDALVDDSTLINLLGCAMHTPCANNEDDGPTLTEMLMDRSVREFGDTTKYKRKTEIDTFKRDADQVMDNVVKEIYTKQPDFFKRHRHLVLRYLQSPAQAPKFGHPESFIKDADMALMCATGLTGEKHSDLFRDHSNSALQYLVS